MHQTFTTDNGVDIAIYVAGYSKDDITVQRTGNYIVVEGETNSRLALEPSFYYKFKVNDADVDPELTNGVLVLHIDTPVSKTETIDIR